MKTIKLLLVMLASLIVVACGGGGSDSPPPSTTLSGTAAVGIPIVNGAVNVTCAAGSAVPSTITNNNGAWSATLSGQTLPCAVQVSGGTISGAANTTSYQSIANAYGIVNVTPLTDLLVANMAGSAAALTPAKLSTITTTNIATALTNLRNVLALPALNTIDPITTAFTPTGGVPMDDILSALQTAMNNASVTYATLQTAAAGANPGAAITLPPVFNTALTAAYAATGSGSFHATSSSTTAQFLSVGMAMSSFSPLTVSGGTAPYIYSHTGTLPAGLSFNTSTGAVTGTPTTAYTTANLVFSVKDANNVVASTTSTVSFTVSAATAVPPSSYNLAGVTANGIAVGGNLIAPVTMGTRAYYYWDVNGDGTSADIGSLTGGDYVLHDLLDQIFDGGALGDNAKDTTHATGNIVILSNGLRIHLLTQTELSALYTAKGVPAGWSTVGIPYYASATQASLGNHYGVNLLDGTASSGGDNGAPSRVAFEVLTNVSTGTAAQYFSKKAVGNTWTWLGQNSSEVITVTANTGGVATITDTYTSGGTTYPTDTGTLRLDAPVRGQRPSALIL